MAPETVQTGPGTPAPGQPNRPDHSFAQAAALGGKAEVGLGQLAEKKGQSKAVSDFGRRMIGDHGKANQQLDELAQAAKVPQPKDADEQHKVMLQYLEKLSGPDLAYIRGQVTEHQMAAQLFEWEIGSGQDSQLRAFAAQVLPTVLRHLELASAIQTELAGSSPEQAASGMSRPERKPTMAR
jgi:putative membrane protein